jgi:hypothetical protein
MKRNTLLMPKHERNKFDTGGNRGERVAHVMIPAEHSSATISNSVNLNALFSFSSLFHIEIKAIKKLEASFFFFQEREPEIGTKESENQRIGKKTKRTKNIA